MQTLTHRSHTYIHMNTHITLIPTYTTHTHSHINTHVHTHIPQTHIHTTHIYHTHSHTHRYSNTHHTHTYTHNSVGREFIKVQIKFKEERIKREQSFQQMVIG